jgi:hypothetical protein
LRSAITCGVSAGNDSSATVSGGFGVAWAAGFTACEAVFDADACGDGDCAATDPSAQAISPATTNADAVL